MRLPRQRRMARKGSRLLCAFQKDPRLLAVCKDGVASLMVGPFSCLLPKDIGRPIDHKVRFGVSLHQSDAPSVTCTLVCLCSLTGGGGSTLDLAALRQISSLQSEHRSLRCL